MTPYQHEQVFKQRFFQCLHFAASRFLASWMPTPAPREGIGAVVPPPARPNQKKDAKALICAIRYIIP